jgi:ABC-2 type transport system permease protein
MVKRVRSVTPYSLALGFGMYVLAAFSGMLGEVKLEYITPFKQLDPAYIATNGAFNTPLLLLNVAVTLIAIGASYWLYIRRDIHEVS